MEPPAHRAGWTRLAQPSRSGRRGVGNPLPAHPNGASETGRDAGGDLQEGPAGDPESGNAEAPDRGPDRTRGLDVDARGREGRHLRGPAGQVGPGVSEGRGSVLHAPRTDQGHRGRHAAGAGRHCLRSRLRHRRIPTRRPRVRGPRARKHLGPRRETPSPTGLCARRGRSCPRPPGSAS